MDLFSPNTEPQSVCLTEKRDRKGTEKKMKYIKAKNSNVKKRQTIPECRSCHRRIPITFNSIAV